MWDRIEALGAWVWRWVTVLAALALAALPPLLAELDTLSGLDLAAVLPPDVAARIVAAVAFVKALAMVTLWLAETIRRRRAAAADGDPGGPS